MKRIAIASLVILSSCATAFDGQKQQINFATDTGETAQCEAKGYDFGHTFEIPTTITVKRSYYPLNVQCKSKDKQADVKIISDVSNWGYGGAVLGLGVGGIVDASSGAAFEYPADVTVTLGESRTVGMNNLNSNSDSNK